jgi:5-methyltetrahydrofolate--homocysteine methyltransferase
MIIIGEKLNGSIPAMAKAIEEKDENYIRTIAKKQAEAGAGFIDICASVSPDIELQTLKWIIDLVQGVTDTPISLDSPNANIFAEAIKLCKKPGLINSVSLEGDKIEKVFPVIANTEWKCVTLLCDDTGIPQSSEKRLEVFGKIIQKAKEYKIAVERLYVDPVVEMLCTSEDGITKVAKTIQTVKEQHPTIHITSGASNISYNLPARKYINRGFIILCMSMGMDSAIIDPLNEEMLGLIYAAEALLGKDEMCIEYINAHRAGLFGKPKAK